VYAAACRGGVATAADQQPRESWAIAWSGEASASSRAASLLELGDLLVRGVPPGWGDG
jgi:hypothetical protein